MKHALTPLLGLALAASFAPAAVAEDCYGLDAARVCVTPHDVPQVDPTGDSIDECVHAGSSCTPVSVPVPTVSDDPNEPLVTAGCYALERPCGDALTFCVFCSREES